MTKTICFIADAASPHSKKWVEICQELNWKLVVISHSAGEINGATVIVQSMTLWGFPKYCWKVRRLLRELQPDLIHAHQFGVHGLYAWFANVAPIVISAWGSDIQVNPKRSLLLRWLVKFLIKKAVFITSVNHFITKELIRFGAKPEQILTFPIGISRQLYQQLSAKPIENKTDLIICSPRLHEPLYNLSVILEAFAKISSEFPTVELWMLGEGSETLALKDYVATHQLDTRVKFWGQVEPEKAVELIAASDLLVSIPKMDGTPVSLLEGLAGGTFPIVSNLPTYHDWIQSGVNGLIINPEPSELAQALRVGLTNFNLREQAAHLNRSKVRETALNEDYFRILFEYYRRVVQPKCEL